MTEAKPRDLMAIVSKAVFEKQARSGARVLGAGDVFAIDRYSSVNRALEPLSGGGRLFLVTVRPPSEALWLVGVLRAPKKIGDAWVAATANTTPITDLSSLRSKLRFESGQGISAKKGALGMSLQGPRVLTAADVALIEGVLPKSAPSPAPDWKLSIPLELSGVRTWLESLRFGRHSVVIEGCLGGSKERRLWIVAAKHGGYVVEWLSLADAAFVYWLVGDSRKRGRTEVMLENGQVDDVPMSIPATLEQALLAVSTFLADGSRDGRVAWVYADGGLPIEDEDDEDEDDDDDEVDGVDPSVTLAPHVPVEVRALMGVPEPPWIAPTRAELDWARAGAAVDRYERRIAGEPIAGIDLTLLAMLSGSLSAAAARLPSSAESSRERRAAVRAIVKQLGDLQRAAKDARRRWPWGQDELLRSIGEQQGATYADFFARQSRATRRPALLVALVESLEQALYATPARGADPGVLESINRKVAMYRTEIALIEGARAKTDPATRAAWVFGDIQKILVACAEEWLFPPTSRGLPALVRLIDRLDEARLTLEALRDEEGAEVTDAELAGIFATLAKWSRDYERRASATALTAL